METKKLYYDDSHRKTFTSKVVCCTQTQGGYEVILEATAFYPEGGGQPGDTGVLGESRVLSVRETDFQIVHLCDRPLSVGEEVAGEIDWERRFDFMQQHSGEHIVSGVIYKMFGYHNTGFHMGSDVVTVDFDGPISYEDMQKIEDQANQAIWQNTEVKCFYPSEEELPTIPYRRKRDLPWPVRLVEFPGVDLCACCGTQVQHTGEIGLVKLLSCVKFHEGVRIEMACGKRAMEILTAIYEQNRQVSQAFSAKAQETGQAACRMNDALAAEKFRSAGLEKRVFAYIAKEYAGSQLALHFEENLTPGANRELCNAIAQQAEVAVTLSGTDAAGYSICIISRTQDAKAIGTAAMAELGGRGGGKPEAFQGTVTANRSAITAYFRQEKK